MIVLAPLAIAGRGHQPRHAAGERVHGINADGREWFHGPGRWCAAGNPDAEGCGMVLAPVGLIG
jgi:hypothetical protein